MLRAILGIRSLAGMLLGGCGLLHAIGYQTSQLNSRPHEVAQREPPRSEGTSLGAAPGELPETDRDPSLLASADARARHYGCCQARAVDPCPQAMTRVAIGGRGLGSVSFS